MSIIFSTETAVTNSPVATICEEIHELTKLPFGWDGFRGVPVSAMTAEFATSLVERIVNQNSDLPSVCSGSDGSLSLEWANDESELEIEITETCETSVSFINLETNDEVFLKNVSDYILVDWITQFHKYDSINHTSQYSKLNHLDS